MILQTRPHAGSRHVSTVATSPKSTCFYPKRTTTDPLRFGARSQPPYRGTLRSGVFVSGVFTCSGPGEVVRSADPPRDAVVGVRTTVEETGPGCSGRAKGRSEAGKGRRFIDTLKHHFNESVDLRIKHSNAFQRSYFEVFGITGGCFGAAEWLLAIKNSWRTVRLIDISWRRYI